MAAIHRAMHIRAGQRAASRAVDAWLEKHEVEVVHFDNVYLSCVHLLKHYEQVVDLAFVDADWLSPDECEIVSYLRETWPRVAVVVYGLSEMTPVFERSPLVRTCRSSGALEDLLTASPDQVVETLCAHSRRESADDMLAEVRPRDALTREPAPAIVAEPPSAPEKPKTTPAIFADNDIPDEPRTLLTAEELGALLDGLDDL